MQLEIILTADDLKILVRDELQRRLGTIELDLCEVKIETKSVQNYKAEWETANFRARVNINR